MAARGSREVVWRMYEASRSTQAQDPHVSGTAASHPACPFPSPPATDIDVLSTHQITNFFHRHNSITKEDCNCTAAKITGSPVSPTLVQGETSHTVAAGTDQPPKAVQFRHSALNLELMNQARQNYGEFVPNCKPYGMIADVHVYEMDFVPGVAFSRARRQLLAPGMEQRLLRTVQAFARS